MNWSNKHVFFGILMGLLSCCLGMIIYVFIFIPQPLWQAFESIIYKGAFNKVISLGNIPNLALFFLFLSKKNGSISKGILISSFLSALAVFWFTI